LAELNSNLRCLDLLPDEVGKLVDLTRVLLEQSLNPNTVQYWIRLDQELLEDGFNKQVRMYLVELCRENGGVREVINSVRQYNTLNLIRLDRIRLGNEVDHLSETKEQLESKIFNNQAMITAAWNAAILGFDSISLAMISVLAQNLGGPYKVANAIQKYQSIYDIDEDLNAKQTKLTMLEKETNEKTGFLSALNYTLKETENVYERNSNVRQVVRLLVDPRGLKMDKNEVVELLALVLYSSIIRIDESIKLPEPPDPNWNDLFLSIKTLAQRLHQYTKSRT